MWSYLCIEGAVLGIIPTFDGHSGMCFPPILLCYLEKIHDSENITPVFFFAAFCSILSVVAQQLRRDEVKGLVCDSSQVAGVQVK